MQMKIGLNEIYAALVIGTGIAGLIYLGYLEFVKEPELYGPEWRHEHYEKQLEATKRKFYKELVEGTTAIGQPPLSIEWRRLHVYGEPSVQLGFRSDGVVVWREYKEKK